MADQEYTFAQARTRLEEIVAQVRKKDTTLEKSLDLLEEGVRLANTCTELSDHTEWRTVVEDASGADEGEPATADAAVRDAAADDIADGTVGSDVPHDPEASAGTEQDAEEPELDA